MSVISLKLVQFLARYASSHFFFTSKFDDAFSCFCYKLAGLIKPKIKDFPKYIDFICWSTFHLFFKNNNNNNFLSSARLHISVQHKRFLFFPILTVALCEVPVALFPLYILHCLCNVHAIYLNINRGFTAKLFRQK